MADNKVLIEFQIGSEGRPNLPCQETRLTS